MENDPSREYFLNLRNAGELPAPNAVGRAGSLVCGAVLRVTLAIADEQIITAAKFKAAGCSFLVATCSLLTERIIGQSTAAAAITVQSKTEVNTVFGPVSLEKEQCLELANAAILDAIRRYSDSVRAEWVGDDALICSCFGVSEQRIENEIERGELRTVGEVTSVCSAGSGCGSCYKLIEDILDDFWRTKAV